jgi:maleate isomerase
MGDRLIRIGILTPHAAPGPEAEFPAMAPGRITTRVKRVADAAGVRVGTNPPAATEVRMLAEPLLLEAAADSLAESSVDVVGYASTSSAYVIGFDEEEVLTARLSRRLGVPVASTCASAVVALRILEVERVALVAPPWFDDELNKLGATYFRSQGLNVVTSGSADLPQDPRRIEPAAVHEWTSRHVPDHAEAVFIGGNGFRAAGAIEALEATLGRPVLTSNQVLLWNLLTQAGADVQVSGYGRLFSRTPPPRDPFG